MQATLTSKGQLTLPKPARDALGLDTGTRFTVNINKSGSLTLTPIRASALSIAGILKPARARPKTVREMDAAVGTHLAEMDKRIRTTGRSGKPGSD